MIELDQRLTRRMRVAEKPGFMRTLAAILAHSADSWFWLAGLLLLWMFGDAAVKPLVIILLVSILLTAMVVFAIKLLVRRRRPEGEWGKFYRLTDPHSFPSGHAARSMMIAIIMLGLAPPWLGLLLLGWAILVSLARVGMGVHYLSDVLAGMILGLMIGALVLLLV